MTSRLATLLGLLVLLCSCGVTAQERPEPIRLSGQPTAGLPPPAGKDAAAVTVYFVRGARLEPVVRAVPTPDVESALGALSGGPTRQEVLSRGLRTALSPQAFRVSRTSPGSPVVSIDVSPELTSVAGGSQLLAVAQVIWTVTQFPDVQRVRLTADGEPLEVPTDEGLSDLAVGREDYRSVAPRGEAPEPGTAGTPPAGTGPPSAGTPGGDTGG